MNRVILGDESSSSASSSADEDGDSSSSSADSCSSSGGEASSLSPDTEQGGFDGAGAGPSSSYRVSSHHANNSNNNAAVRRRMPPVSSGGRSISSGGGGGDSDPDDAHAYHRRNYLPQQQQSQNNNSNNERHRHHRKHNKKKRPSPPALSILTKLRRACRKANHPTIMRHVPTLFLCACFLFWLAVQTTNVYDSIAQSTHAGDGDDQRRRQGSVGQRNARLAARNKGNENNGQQQLLPNNDNNNNQQRQQQPPPRPPPSSKGGGFLSTGSFLGDAVDGFMDIVGLPAKVFRQVSLGEGLAPGCVRSPWQALNLPNCNDMHETDLYEVFAGKVRKDGGYVGSGYWRHVWLVDPRYESFINKINNSSSGEHTYTSASHGAVLKMMKSEHKVEPRNFERHRRDALAMERLTASPNIVDIYSYCGNSILTEYVGSDMHKVLYHTDDDEQTIADKVTLTRSDKEKLQLALEVVKGVAALHEVPGGPIVHADIADKQFLIDARGIVKLNDFNRCRFMGHKTGTKDKCSFRIPSAPGRHRSPEEYEDRDLTEQLDTYSTAHVLYGILTGSAPWEDLPSSQVKRAVKHGAKPPIGDDFRTPGTTDALLASLIDRAYEHDPKVRISAPELVTELELAINEL